MTVDHAHVFGTMYRHSAAWWCNCGAQGRAMTADELAEHADAFDLDEPLGVHAGEAPTPGTWDELTDAELRARAHGVELRRRGLAVQIADRLAELRDLDLRANDADDEAEALAAELARRGVPGPR